VADQVPEKRSGRTLVEVALRQCDGEQFVVQVAEPPPCRPHGFAQLLGHRLSSIP
jgi:hypothetical protein